MWKAGGHLPRKGSFSTVADAGKQCLWKSWPLNSRSSFMFEGKSTVFFLSSFFLSLPFSFFLSSLVVARSYCGDSLGRGGEEAGGRSGRREEGRVRGQ